MAHTTDDTVHLTIPITKATEDAAGNLYVEGLATNDALDLDEQIIDKDFARSGLTKWFSDWGNVRQMHSTALPPAGKAVECTEVPEGHRVKTLVVEPTAKELVKSGVYQAYSVGISKPRIIRDGLAKNGRVVDGVFTEISLVDFPANPTCKFMLAKRAEGGDPEVVEKVTPADLAKLASLQQRAAGADDEHAAKIAAQWYALFKRDMDPNVGGGVDRDEIPGEDFAGKDRSFPIVTPGDVSDAATSIGRAGASNYSHDKLKANIIRIAHRKGKSFVAELPESWKTDSEKTLEVDLTKADMKECPTCDGSGKIRDGHVTCPDCHGKGKVPADFEKTTGPDVAKQSDAQPHLADHPEPDGDEHGPDVDNDGDGKAMKVAYHLARLHDATCAAYTDTDVLTAHPAVAKGIPAVVDVAGFADRVSKALTDDAGTGSHIGELPGLSQAYGLAVSIKAMDPELAEHALADVRKAFAELYPDAHPTPTDMTPGKFNRPYIGAGHAPLSAPGSHKPRIPLSSHVPSAGQFDRGPLTGGHQSLAPGKAAEPDLVKSYFTAAAKEQAGELLKSMHDYITGQHPGVCPMTGPAPAGEPAIAGAQGSSVTVALADTATQANKADATLQPVDPASAVHAAGEPDLTKAVLDPDTLKAAVRDVYAEEFATMTETIESLTKRLADIEAQPDPAAAAVRGPAALVKSQTPAGRGDDEDEEAVERVVRLVKAARHPDSTVSAPAMDKLIRQVGAEHAAGLINP